MKEKDRKEGWIIQKLENRSWITEGRWEKINHDVNSFSLFWEEQWK